MKHKHYEMIVAKAANMDLVVLSNYIGTWFEVDNENLSFFYSDDYFLCLPQHKETCLHWLNGGSIQFKDSNGQWSDTESVNSSTEMCKRKNIPFWNSKMTFMRDDYSVRIKPRKEKRWIIAMKDGGSMSLCGKQLHASKGSAIDFAELHGTTSHLQFIEIEIEV